MASNVQVIIQAVDKASKEIGKVSTALNDIDKSSGKGAAGFDAAMSKVMLTAGAVAGSAAAMGAALKSAFEIGQQGAAVNQTADSFDLLLKTVGGAPDLLDQLRRASRGTVDDMTLMSATATLLAGTSDELSKALADASPQILELAKAANKLNPQLGDTAFLYNSLMTGIKRGSPMLIDNTGITLKLGEANEKMAKSLGKTTEELTSEEQKLAILNATLEAGDNMLRQVGGNVDSLTDSYSQLGAALKNTGDKLKGIAAPAITEQVDGLNGSLDVFATNLEELARGDSIFEILARNQERYAELETKLENNKWIKGWQSDAREAGVAARYAAEDTDVLTEAIEEIKETTEEAAEAQKLLKNQFDTLREIIKGDFGKAINDYKDDMDTLLGKQAALWSQIKNLESRSYLTDKQKEELAELKAKHAELGLDMRGLANEHEEAMKRMAFNMLMERAASDGLTENEIKNLTTIGQHWGLYDQKTADVINSINSNIGQLDTSNPQGLLDILRAILGLPAEKTFLFTVNYKQNGGVPPGLGDVGLPGGTSAPIQPVAGTGEYVNEGKRAAGGPVSGYIVNESAHTRPEVTVLGGRNGYTLTKQQAQEALSGGGGGVVINGPITVQANDPQTFIAQLQALGRKSRQAQIAGAQYQGA